MTNDAITATKLPFDSLARPDSLRRSGGARFDTFEKRTKFMLHTSVIKIINLFGFISQKQFLLHNNTL